MKALVVDGAAFDRAKCPTMAYILDALLQVHDDLRRETLDPLAARTMVTALKSAGDLMQKERDLAAKEKAKAAVDDAPAQPEDLGEALEASVPH